MKCVADPPANDPTNLRDWIGRCQETGDRIDPWHAAALHATLGCEGAPPASGQPLPEGWHWAWFRDAPPSTDLGPDGHAARGRFLPPAPGKRMWAGGRLRFAGPLRIGGEATRRSSIREVTPKQGRSGPLVLVTVEHEIVADGALAICERQDIVYRTGPPGTAQRGPEPLAAPAWTRTLTPDPVLLFRYSALTFNGHRIHYDADYAREVEGYPGIVVHGPLIATLLLDLLRRCQPARRIAEFSYRAVAPLFAGETLRLETAMDPGTADGLLLSAVGPAGRVVMTASARLAMGNPGGGVR